MRLKLAGKEEECKEKLAVRMLGDTSVCDGRLYGRHLTTILPGLIRTCHITQIKRAKNGPASHFWPAYIHLLINTLANDRAINDPIPA
ncbi:hypothetical protein [Collimonas silvisoli]|uniref:hypothetical protein n=1 Tax=Collimonas silvisoli TaxID=2825884 RepID=UPI001B8D7D73|nr:hypothetical protein [Collimonas silvisoli]